MSMLAVLGLILGVYLYTGLAFCLWSQMSADLLMSTLAVLGLILGVYLYILVVISATKTGGRLICGSTYMQVDTVTKLPAAKTSMYNLFSYNNINIKILDLISYEIH